MFVIIQVLALALYPALLDEPTFPDDAKERARRVLGSCRGDSVGQFICSSHSFLSRSTNNT